MIEVGPRVKAVREAKGLSLKHVAERLNVVHTTIHMYEKLPDLKSALIKQLAEILEVNHAYLTGDDPELEDVDVKWVVRRESLRLFLAGLPLSDRDRERERRRLERIRDHRLAPVTVDKWPEMRAFVHQLLGRPPGAAVPTPETGSAPAGEQQTPDTKKRMARIDTMAPSKDQRLRRVG